MSKVLNSTANEIWLKRTLYPSKEMAQEHCVPLMRVDKVSGKSLNV